MNKGRIFGSVVLVILCWVTWNDHRELANMTNQLETQKSKQNVDNLHPAAAAPVLVKGTPEDQAKCAKQSKGYFDQWFRSAPAEDKSPHVSQTFSDHYDSETRSCYVEIVVTPVKVGNEFSTTKFVSDAYEGSDLADYLWISKTGKKYWEVKPMECHVKGRDGKDNYCDSDDSFKEMIFKAYGLNE